MVFNVNTNANGNLDKFKARLVATSFTHIEGEEFFQIFAPVSDVTTDIMLLAITSVKRPAIIQLYVKNAFMETSMLEGYHDGIS